MLVYVSKQVKVRLASNEIQLDSFLVIYWLLQLVKIQ